MARPRKPYRVRKHTRKDKKTGERKESFRWNIIFRDHLDIERKLTGTTDESTSEYIARNIIKIVNLKACNQPLTPESRSFIESRPKEFRKKLLEWDILTPDIDSNFEPLMIYEKVKPKHSSKKVYDITGGHLFDWRKSMEGDELTTYHIRETITKVAKAIDACNFCTPNDIDAQKLKRWLTGLRRKGATVCNTNNFLKAFKSFVYWMLKNDRLQHNPVQGVQPLKKLGRQRIRRALSAGEVGRLLTATIDAGHYHGLAGHERNLVYQIAIYTGFRYNEIYTLERKDIAFGSEPNITIQAHNAKNGKCVTLPLQKELSQNLKQYFVNNTAIPNIKVFPGMWKRGGAKMLKKDSQSSHKSVSLALQPDLL
jgi:site-specific recombinase XerC